MYRALIIAAIAASACHAARPSALPVATPPSQHASSPPVAAPRARCDLAVLDQATPHELGAIRGLICDATTHEALAGGTVVIDGRATTAAAISDELGRFEIVGLAPGDHTVTYYYDCHQAAEIVHVTTRDVSIVSGAIDRRTACPVIIEPLPTCRCGPSGDYCTPRQGVTLDATYLAPRK